jgi:hypothetical protein
MKFFIYCPCGVPVAQDLIESAIDECCAHAIKAHGMKLTPEQALEMVAIVGSASALPRAGIADSDRRAGVRDAGDSA